MQKRTLLDGLTGGSDDRLDLVRVDETGDVSSRDLGGREADKNCQFDNMAVSRTNKNPLEARLLLVDRVEGGNGRLGPDDESTNVTTRGELEEVEGLNGAGLDTGDVLESPDDTLVLGVDDEGTPPLPVPPVPHLTLTGPDLPRVGNLGDVGVGSDSLEELDSSLGLVGGLDGRREDEGDLLDLLDPVASGEDKRGESRGSEGRSNGVSSLVLVHLDVPLPPGLGRGEHSTTSAHVTESGLARSLGTTTANTGDTGNGTTGTPRLGRGLVTGVLSNGVSLSTVLGDRLCFFFHVVRDIARFALSYISSSDSLWTCWTTSSLMGAVKTAGRGREPEDSPVADQTVTVGRAAILMFCGVEHLTDEEEREIHTLSNFPYRRTRRYIRRFDQVYVAMKGCPDLCCATWPGGGLRSCRCYASWRTRLCPFRLSLLCGGNYYSHPIS